MLGLMFIFAPKDALQLAVRLGLIFGKQGSSPILLSIRPVSI